MGSGPPAWNERPTVGGLAPGWRLCPQCSAPLQTFNYRCRQCGTIVDPSVAQRLNRIRIAIIVGLVVALLVEAVYFGLKTNDLVWSLGLTGGILVAWTVWASVRRPRPLVDFGPGRR